MAEPDGYWYSTMVRYSEVDAQNVVFNMWYLGYFDEAMGGYLAACGYPYPELIRDRADTQVVHAEIDWTGSVGWGDTISVGVRTAGLGATSFTLDFDLRRAGQRVCTGRNVYVVIATDGSGKMPIPGRLRAALSRAATPTQRT
jgi:acyl-CoA thioester hydrolase